MAKPKAKKIERLDYHECADYIGELLGYDLDDTLGKFGRKSYDDKIEYRCFWSFIVDHCEIHNGCEFWMPSPDDEWYFKDKNSEWVKPILEAFHKEFGEGPYWASW